MRRRSALRLSAALLALSGTLALTGCDTAVLAPVSPGWGWGGGGGVVIVHHGPSVIVHHSTTIIRPPARSYRRR